MEERLKEFQSQLESHARRRVKRNPILSLDTEDLVQDGMAAMWLAWLHYKDTGKSPEDMAKLCFRAALNRMIDSERRVMRQKRALPPVDKAPADATYKVRDRISLEEILDVRFRIRTVASNLSEAGQKLFKELFNPSDDLLDRARYKKGFNVRDYAESLGLTDRNIKMALKEIKQGLENSGFGCRLYRVRGAVRTREEMSGEKDKTFDPLDYGLVVPDPEEEVGWDPALDEPNTPEEIEEEERHEAAKVTGGVVDLDQPLGDLGEMGAEIEREEAREVSSKSEQKLDKPSVLSTPPVVFPEPKEKPKRPARKKRDKDAYMKGFEAGSDGAKIWAHLEELFLSQGQAITHEDIRGAYKTVLGSDDEKAAKQARFMMWTLHKKKKLLVRVERGVFKKATDDQKS